MKKKVVISARTFLKSGQDAIKMLTDKGYEVITNTTGRPFTYEEMYELSADVDGIIVGLDKIDKELLDNAKNLKVVCKFGVGVENIDVEYAEKLGVKVERAIGSNSTSVAELAIGLIFQLAREIVQNANEVKAGKWNKTLGIELKGKTLGILGFGNIGKQVARIAHGIGMKILAYDPYVNPESALKDYDVQMMLVEDILKSSDFVTLHMPLTDENRYIINSETLSMMKKTAYLVNTARGDLVDEEALYDALKNGVIAGAAEDVFSKEPPEADSKLLKLDNFILTSHLGAVTADANANMINQSVENLLRVLE
jgi:D-3-phosphoglycerate dehydrogenase